MGYALRELAEIYDNHALRIFQYIYHRLGDQSLAEDLTSEVFIRFLRSRSAPNNVSAFLYRVAHNLIVDYLRTHHATLLLDDQIAEEQNDPIQLAEMEDERRQLRRAILRLAPAQQQVIVLKFLEGLSNEEIARVLSKPAGAIKSLQHRGLVTLRDMLFSQMQTR